MDPLLKSEKETATDFENGHLFLSIFTFLKMKFTKDLQKTGCDENALNPKKIIQKLAAYFFSYFWGNKFLGLYKRTI
jgi:hypothetical protein